MQMKEIVVQTHHLLAKAIKIIAGNIISMNVSITTTV